MTLQKIWITGASTGIGEAATLRLAGEGRIIFATARSKEKLESLSMKAADLPGKIIPYQGDVTDAKRMREIVGAIQKDYGGLDTVLLNAGTYFADKEDQFTVDNFVKTFDVNVFGVANCLEPVLDVFQRQGYGHIAIVASVAGFRGLPKSLAYGPTKAALINMAEAMYMDFMPRGIKVQVINPGFIRTPLTDKNDFPMPMLMEVEDAAKVLVQGLKSDRFEINFPWMFCYLKKIIDLLPNKLYLNLIGAASSSQSRDQDKRQERAAK